MQSGCPSIRDAIRPTFPIDSAPCHQAALSSGWHGVSSDDLQLQAAWLLFYFLEVSKGLGLESSIEYISVGMLPPMAMVSYPDKYLSWRLKLCLRPVHSFMVCSLRTCPTRLFITSVGPFYRTAMTPPHQANITSSQTVIRRNDYGRAPGP
jgi:hypothetical protein